LYPDAFYEIATPLPPIAEQAVIADFIDREVSNLNVLGRTISEAIDRLKEYRTALISATVTGKIDVRREA
jgi:restriction endonuclease S subunit